MCNADFSRSARSGFTLLELTISASIASVMLGIMGYSISSASATTQLVQMTSDLDQTAHRVLDRIAADLRSNPKGVHVLTSTAGYAFPGTGTLSFRSFNGFTDLSCTLPTSVVAYAASAPIITIAVRNNAYASASALSAGELVRTVTVNGVSTSETLTTGVNATFAAAPAQLGSLACSDPLIVTTGVGSNTPGFFAVLDTNADPSGHILAVGLTLGGRNSRGEWITRSTWTQVHLDTP